MAYGYPPRLPYFVSAQCPQIGLAGRQGTPPSGSPMRRRNGAKAAASLLRRASVSDRVLRRWGQNYAAFVDSSGGRNDAYVVCIGHRDKSDRFIVDVIRGQKAPFNPAHVTIGFAGLVREYGIRRVVGDAYGGVQERSARGGGGDSDPDGGAFKGARGDRPA
jgi:hypothetical protein